MNATTLFQESERQHGFYVPRFEIRIEGAGLPRDVLRDVGNLVYRDSLREIDGFELRVNNWDADTRAFKYVGAERPEDLEEGGPDSARFRLFEPCGKRVEVWMGYTGTLRLMVDGSFTTMAPEFSQGGAPALTVRGLNALHRLRRKQYSSTWGQTRDSDIAADIGTREDRELGDGHKRFPMPIVTCAAARDFEPELDYVAQRNQYDIDFLLTRARRCGYVVYLREGDPQAQQATQRQAHLYFGPSDGRVPAVRDVTFRLKWGVSLISFTPTLTTANQVRAVTVNGWDRVRKQGITARVTLDDRELQINRDLHGLLDNCDAREEVVVDRPVGTEREARALALAILRDRQKEMVTASASCVGLPDLRAGRKVEIEGVGARFSGCYFVTATTHTIGEGGYITSFEARREAVGALEGLQ